MLLADMDILGSYTPYKTIVIAILILILIGVIFHD